MKNMLKCFAVTVIFTLAISPQAALGIEAGALKEMLDQGEKVTIIDIRSLKLYAANHIRGAINIPAGIMARKPLPPIGRVILCGDGIRQDITLKAVEELNTRPGIQAESLEGGFAAWQTLNLPGSRSPGMKSEALRYITYEELGKASEGNQNMVLVDMRLAVKNKVKTGRDMAAGDNPNLSDLSEKFPDLEVITLDRKHTNYSTKGDEISLSKFSGTKRGGDDKVYVLIDSGDGKSEDVARRLYGSGLKQVVILIGGERILQREGRQGSQKKVVGESL